MQMKRVGVKTEDDLLVLVFSFIKTIYLFAVAFRGSITRLTSTDLLMGWKTLLVKYNPFETETL